MTLYPDRVYITKVKDIEEGLELPDALTATVNATWEHCQELFPVLQGRRAPRPLDM